MEDQSDIDKQQAQIDAERAANDKAQMLAGYEYYLAQKEAKENGRANDDEASDKYDAAKKEWRQNNKDLNDRQETLSQTQTELNGNRWGNTDIPNGGGMNKHWEVDANGNPKMYAYAEKKDGTKQKYYADPTRSERNAFFNQDTDGTYTAKTWDQAANGVRASVATQAGSIDYYYGPVMQGVGYGAAIVVGAPVAAHLSKEGAVFLLQHQAETIAVMRVIYELSGGTGELGHRPVLPPSVRPLKTAIIDSRP